MRLRFTLLFIIAFCLRSFADTEWIDSATFTPSGSPTSSSGVGSNGRLGERVLTTSTTVTITELGVYVVAGGTHTHTIAIKHEGDCGNTVASVSLDFTGLSAGVHYVALGSPVTLLNSDSYYAFVTAVDGEDAFYVTQDISPTSDMTCPDAAYALDATTCSNPGVGANKAHGPVFIKYTTGGGGCGGTESPTNLLYYADFFAGDFVPTVYSWSNTCASTTCYYISTNGGSTFDTVKCFGSPTSPATNTDTVFIRIYETYQVKFSYDGVNFSATTNVWGMQKAINFFLSAQAVDRVFFSFRHYGSTNAPGSMIEVATNSDMSGNKMWWSIPYTNSIDVLFTKTFAFEADKTYYFRAYATNANGLLTYPYTILQSAPNSIPVVAKNFGVLNASGGVGIHFEPGDGGGYVDKFYVDASVGDTNNYVNVFSTASGALGYDTTDGTQTPGTHVYYRCISSNSLGVAVAPIQDLDVAVPVDSLNFYLSTNGAAGSGIGTNAANPWRGIASINWESMKPGSTIYVYGGSYQNTLRIVNAFGTWSGGTRALPIVFKRVPGDTKRIEMPVYVNSYGAIRYLQLNGERIVGLKPLTRQAVTNNTGWAFIGNTNNPRGVITHLSGFNMTGIEVTGDFFEANQANTGEGTVSAVYFDGGTISNELAGVHYCWIHDMNRDPRVGGDGISPAGYFVTNGGVFQVDWTVSEKLAGNHIDGSADHADIGHNWFLHSVKCQNGLAPTGNHLDVIQGNIAFSTIHDNWFEDTDGYCIYPEVNYPDHNNINIFNNVFRGTGALLDENNAVLPKGGIQWTMETGVTNGVVIHYPIGIVTNVLIANNTFIGFDFGFQGYNRRSVSFDACTLSNWTMVNNLVVNHVPIAQFGISVYIDSETLDTNAMVTNNMVLNYNDTCGTNTDLAFNGITYLYSDIPAALGYSSNFTYYPEFSSVLNLTDHDRTNMVGTNLLSLRSVAPGIERTQDGYLRSVLGWQVGALSTIQDSHLIMWGSFISYTGSNTVEDATPHNHNLFIPVAGNGANVYSNYPALFSDGPPNGKQAISFSDYQYLVQTNLEEFDFTNGCTFMLWGRYPANAAGDTTFFDYGIGSTCTNAFLMGHFNSDFSTGVWITHTNGAFTKVVAFPDSQSGNDTGWTNYCWTFTPGAPATFVGYVNGLPVTTNTSYNVAFLKPKFGTSNPVYGCWGAFSHEGTADPIDDENADTLGNPGHDSYPNAGYRARIAEPKVWDVPLSATNVYLAYLDIGTESGGGGGGGGSTNVTATLSGRITIQGSVQIR